MESNQASMTLRQRYEAEKNAAMKRCPNLPPLLKDDSFLGELIGCRITVSFMNGEETTGMLKAFYRFALKLDGGIIIFKHAIQSVRPAAEQNPRSHPRGV